MRLTNLKLAGFKSFPEPTHLSLPGDLVGIVGPNGCGKSNVIDAVRWVLGESQARHLRGETMQDVIFNGTTDRKPVSRASVELIFDNSLGRAAGQWSNYAEIAVKRVLERNGESSYHINGSHVRRRDVTDIFMGTGLGPRAYAIIEQGMISRVIESKPEELRVFLEEAAGISKYKERRRETELRLSDTRENLARVEDIRTELGGQIERLQVQAQAAQRYHELQSAQRTAQNLLWLIKRRDAANARERAAREIERLGNELEAEIAKLREAEKNLEQIRQGHYTASDAVHQAQGELYGANAETARLENQLQYLRDNKRRLASQLAQLLEQSTRLAAEQRSGEAELATWRAELSEAQEHTATSMQEASRLRDALPASEHAFETARQQLSTLTQQLAQAEQNKSLAEAHRTHAEKLLQQLTARRERLQEEKNSLVAPDQAALQHAETELRLVQANLGRLQQALTQEQQLAPQREDAAARASAELEAVNGKLTKVDAQIHALEQLQTQQRRDEKIQSFLSSHHLDGLPRLWQLIHVEPGWEDALESVLNLRLNAVQIADLDQVALLDPAAPGGITLFAATAGHASDDPPHALIPLRARVLRADPLVEGILDDWLRGTGTVERWRDGLDMRRDLAPGALLVSKEGHLISRNSVSFFAPQAEMHGLLARSREIAGLKVQQQELRIAIEQHRAAQVACEQSLRANRDLLAEFQDELSAAQAHEHRWQMERLQLKQQADQVSQRAQKLETELGEIELGAANEARGRDESLRRLADLALELGQLVTAAGACKEEHDRAQAQLSERRMALQTAEKSEQEARFLEKSVREKIQAQEQALASLGQRSEELSVSHAAVQTEHASLSEDALEQELQQALNQRTEKEAALAAARQQLEGAASALTGLEQERLAAEQKIHPLREKVGEIRLKEQEARLNEESFAEQFKANNGVEEELLPLIEKGTKASGLQGEINRIAVEIAELGAVNLAALSELEAARERKAHLDRQSADLHEALETLENAIRRIDRETRERLHDTFEQVNKNFSALFPTLFGGGQARIEMTGEEILDAGVLVVAQPPGKRTSSIHLLSGGEKALTAMALVFALFQLNPAPFCLLDEVDAPLDDTNTERFCELVKKMARDTQFLFISHNKITMEMANHLIGITMQESGVSRVVAVDIEQAMRLTEEAAA